MAVDEFQHFIEAQEPVYDRVVQELVDGEKRSHWMWFIFPQVIGLGHSFMAQRFALHSLKQAERYAGHPVLGKRLRECARLVLNLENRSVPEIFGHPDDLKFHSSMTLFTLALPQETLFDSVLAKYFAGQRDLKTVEILSGQA
ncbi:MAG TPA: DUF1810 domain-containing protein [Candidatus Binatia bacterium]|nr:DUF1810 domain-containing protein [Candidatus Binatia bacterium]